MWAERILAEVNALPPDLASKPYLQPIYGCPTFIVHGILRRHSGWFDGNPSHLFPAATSAVAKEIVALAGAPELLARARTLQQAGDAQLALHLVDCVIDGGDQTLAAEAQRLKSDLLATRAENEPSFIARNIPPCTPSACARPSSS